MRDPEGEGAPQASMKAFGPVFWGELTEKNIMESTSCHNAVSLETDSVFSPNTFITKPETYFDRNSADFKMAPQHVAWRLCKPSVVREAEAQSCFTRYSCITAKTVGF